MFSRREIQILHEVNSDLPSGKLLAIMGLFSCLDQSIYNCFKVAQAVERLLNVVVGRL